MQKILKKKLFDTDNNEDAETEVPHPLVSINKSLQTNETVHNFFRAVEFCGLLGLQNKILSKNFFLKNVSFVGVQKKKISPRAL